MRSGGRETTDGKDSLKITVKAPTLRGRFKPRLQKRWRSNLKLCNRSDRFSQGGHPVPPV
jgi:hypothetical protein